MVHCLANLKERAPNRTVLLLGPWPVVPSCPKSRVYKPSSLNANSEVRRRTPKLSCSRCCASEGLARHGGAMCASSKLLESGRARWASGVRIRCPASFRAQPFWCLEILGLSRSACNVLSRDALMGTAERNMCGTSERAVCFPSLAWVSQLVRRFEYRDAKRSAQRS